MRVAYIAETSLDNRSAYTHHVIKMCDAFCIKNSKTTLIIPFINKKITFKKIKKNFLLTSKKKFLIKTILNFKVSNFLTRILFGYKAANYLSKNCPELIITRSFISSIFFTFFKINHFLEIHSEFRGLTKFLMINLNKVFAPAIAKLYHEDKIPELNELYKKTSFLVNLLTIPLSVIIVIFANEVLALYTSDMLNYKSYLFQKF